MKKALLFTFPIFILISCGGNSDADTDGSDSTVGLEESMSFETLEASKTGIDFYNTVEENEQFNFYTYEYIYNGAGVAVGDINNDGLTDIYFAGNQVQDKLYLNKGNMEFEDISSSAFDENANEGWHTGVNMVDINADGFLDIYVCRSGDPEDKTLMGNLLFINNQDNTFTEKGAEYGVDIQRRSTHSAFFDYDNDGDLDLYVLNHPNKLPGDKLVTASEFRRIKMFGEDADVLLENKDGKFEDVSEKAGILSNCYGLGIAIGDLDGNGYSDIYISNDYQDPDLVYMNRGDGTFVQDVERRTQHISNYSMGNDIADFNNDGYLDIMTVDMAAEDHVRSKRNMGAMSSKDFWETVTLGMHYQYMFNGLQMNNGNGTFTEVSQIAGVSKTDWSWAPLFADFDNDGHKDLFITNGYNREARDNDYGLEYDRRAFYGDTLTYEEGLAIMPTAKIYNYIFKNDGDIGFTKKVDEWKFDAPVNSNGAAFADLDNDGDLDLIVNNMEETSFIMENKLQSSNSYVRLNVKGEEKNINAIGARVTITTGDNIQYHEIQVTRGYESSVEHTIHFGLGNVDKIDKLEIEWLNGRKLTRENLAVNQTHTIKISEANGTQTDEPRQPTLFTNITDSVFTFSHTEAKVNDFEREVLMPHKMSQLGPFISEGDVNGDGLDDLFISGATGFSGVMYIQNENGGFSEKSGPWSQGKAREELGSAFVDVDGDGDQDLYVVSGGNEYDFSIRFYQDQLYINDGKGNFKNETVTRLPKLEASGQSVAVGDYDGDGDPDLYVGGRQMPGFYPYTTRSFLLENVDGKFTDVTSSTVGSNQTEESISLAAPGMVTDAIFDDFDNDNDLDLVIVGEWMPITFFENSNGKFDDVTKRYNPSAQRGWWYSISKGDFNGDGKSDYIVGNVGGNNKFHPSETKPLEIYVKDFDENGTEDIVLAKYQDNICYPVRGRQCSSEQMPFIKNKFPTYGEYATADIDNIYGQEALDAALHYSAKNFHSVVLMSNDGGFEEQDLPIFAQLGPVNKSIVFDANNDGNMDVVTVGNNFSVEVETVRYDGGRGAVLLGDGKGNFEQLSPLESGFFENNDCKDMVRIEHDGSTMLITVSNRNKAKTFLLN